MSVYPLPELPNFRKLPLRWQAIGQSHQLSLGNSVELLTTGHTQGPCFLLAHGKGEKITARAEGFTSTVVALSAW